MRSSAEQHLNQWHETHRIEEQGVVYFLKKFQPDSYEVRNELSWLVSTMIKSCHNFGVPTVREASIKEGFIKMDFIEQGKEGRPLEEIIDYLVSAAVELHGLVRSHNPRLRTPVSKSEYGAFLKKYTTVRLDSLKGTPFEIPVEIEIWILEEISKLKNEYFNIVHRDMRARHMLFGSGSDKPTLIDWEFANISDPAQDVAKMVYDATTHGYEKDKVLKRVLESYAYLKGVSKDELEQHVRAFLPIIPLERSMSLVNRKPAGYEREVIRDLCFIRAIYEER